MKSQLHIKGKVALVTGAGGGIGGACAGGLVAAGLRVAVVDSRLSAARTMAEKIGDTATAQAYELDVRDAAAVGQIFRQVAAELGRVDVLVNAAGIYPSDPLLEMSEEAWDRVLDTNLKGPHLCVQAFARPLVAAGKAGVVVNISSGAAKRARRGAAHYCTSKAGLSMLTAAQALELAQYGIRVNGVAPGYVEVHSEVNPVSEEYERAIVGGIPLKRAGTPVDIANTVLFLCSEESCWMTGSVLSIDGGTCAGSLSLPFLRS